MKKQLINSIEHAMEVLGQNVDFGSLPDALRSVGLPERDIQPTIDDLMLKKITEASNKLNNWEADWADASQAKWSIYAPRVVKDPASPSGFGLAFSYTNYWYSHTNVGARLTVGSSEEAEHIFKHFKPLWESSWLIIKEKTT